MVAHLDCDVSHSLSPYPRLSVKFAELCKASEKFQCSVWPDKEGLCVFNLLSCLALQQCWR